MPGFDIGVFDGVDRMDRMKIMIAVAFSGAVRVVRYKVVTGEAAAAAGTWADR